MGPKNGVKGDYCKNTIVSLLQDIIPGQVGHAEQMMHDSKYITPAIPTAVSELDDKKFAKIEKMEIDAPKQEDDEFFMGGIPGIGDDDSEKGNDSRETRKWSNRTPQVTLDDLSQEFRELVEMDDDGVFTNPFINTLIDDVTDSDPEGAYEYTIRLRSLFATMFAAKLKQIIEKRELSFPLIMDVLQDRVGNDAVYKF